MWDLEYLLLFGVPGNKWELWDGKMHCRFPFEDRATAEAHWEPWLETLCRWQGVSGRPAVNKTEKTWESAVGEFVMTLFPRPINLDVPFDGEAFDAIYHSFWRREFWEQPLRGCETGYDCFISHQDVKHNLWRLFEGVSARQGGESSSVDIALSDVSAVAPDIYYYAKPAGQCMIGRDYFFGPPDLIGEVLSTASRAWDRGPRLDVYRRAGIPHVWLLEPEPETVEVYELEEERYQQRGVYGPGDEFPLAISPQERVSVDELFDTQAKRWGPSGSAQDPEPVAEWIVSPNERLGLQYLLLLGHPDRRYEIWNNRVPCLLSFGSAAEAGLRYRHFLEDICRWERIPRASSSQHAADLETAEAGRFRLIRDGHRVQLEVAVDARKFRQLLHVWPRREAWDWGDDS